MYKLIFSFVHLFLFSFIFFNFSYATKIPDNLEVDEKTLQLLQKIKEFPMGNREDGNYYLLYYSEEFAKMINKYEEYQSLDPKKAKKLAPNVLAVGLSITQKKPATETRFEEYACEFHLFVPYRNDYWLPEGNYGDWFSDLDMRDQIYNFTDATVLYGKEMEGYSQRTFMSELLPDNEFFGGTSDGNLGLIRFKKNIFPNVIYLKLHHLCISMPKPGKDYSIWVERTGGIDYTRSQDAFIDKKYFHYFPVPASLINESCKYLQKASYLQRWNQDLNHAYAFYPKQSYIDSARELYQCNNY